MASLNPFRRTRQLALVASGDNVNISDSSAVDSVLKRQEDWQKRAVNAKDACGEVNLGISQLSEMMSMLTSFAAEKPRDKDAMPDRTDNATAIEVAERLGTMVEVSTLLADMTSHLVTIGETQLLGIAHTKEREALGIYKERWVAYSHLEIEKHDIRSEDGTLRSGIRIDDFFDGQPLILDSATGDTWIRIWRPHPFRKSKADSHIRPLLQPIDELLWWDHAAEAIAKNRLATVGLMGIPSNLELPPEAGEDPRASGSQRFIKRLFDTAKKTIANPGLASAAIPLFFTYPWNETGKSGVDVINFDRPTDVLLEQRTDRALRRIAQGFPLPVETFFGVGDASQFGGREISETKFRENTAPFARFVFSALTMAWYQPILRDEGVENWQDYILWYDASNLIVHPDITQGADKGVEYGMIGGAAWRRVRGFREADAPDEQERKDQLAWLRGLRGRDLSLPAEGADTSPDEPTAPTTHQGHAPKEKVGAPVRDKGQPVLASSNGNGHIPELHIRLQTMCDEKVRRALEKAGNKLRSRANKDAAYKSTIRGVGAEEVASTLGRAEATKLGISDLFDGAFSDIPARLDHLAHAAGIETNLSHSTFLVSSLREIAATHLFSPPTSLDPIVPMSIIDKTLNGR